MNPRTRIRELAAQDGVLNIQYPHLFLAFRKGDTLIGVEDALAGQYINGLELYFSDYGYYGMPVELIGRNEFRNPKVYKVVEDTPPVEPEEPPMSLMSFTSEDEMPFDSAIILALC